MKIKKVNYGSISSSHAASISTPHVSYQMHGRYMNPDGTFKVKPGGSRYKTCVLYFQSSFGGNHTEDASKLICLRIINNQSNKEKQ